jgi:adenylate kinase family enzyme
MKSKRTALVVGGLSLAGKGTLARLLAEQVNGSGHIFEMGHEFRSIKEGRGSFAPHVHDFVTRLMPKGDLAAPEVYLPVLQAAWERHRSCLESAQLAVFDGVVRTAAQWPIFRQALVETWGQHGYRVGVIWLERPDEKCIANWRKRLVEGSAREDDRNGETTQRRRLRLAREAWAPLHDRFSSGKSTAGYLHLNAGEGLVEHRLEEIVGWVQGIQPIAALPRHDILVSGHDQGSPALGQLAVA